MQTQAPALYKINLIRDLREREKKKEERTRLALILGLGCFGFFLLSVIYSSLTIWQMEKVLTHESTQVVRLKQEYQKYKATRLIIDKTDIELLDGLKSKGFLWTKKLAALANHLPDNCSITSFSYEREMLHVTGYGFVNPKQDQLLILDDYLNKLRADTTFSDTFTKLQLNSADRKEEGGRFGFDFSATAKTWRPQ